MQNYIQNKEIVLSHALETFDGFYIVVQKICSIWYLYLV